MFRSKLGLLFVVVALGSTLAGGTGSLQSDLGAVLKADPRNNEGFVISVRYRPAGSILIYDLESVSLTKSMADVFRVFLQFAQAEKGQSFKSVELAFRGQTRFILSGEYFKKLGEEYGVQNPVFTMRTFTENLATVDGSRAYPTWSGGLLGVTSKQVEQFNDFHQRWWMRDMVQAAPGAQTAAVAVKRDYVAQAIPSDVPAPAEVPAGSNQPLELPGWLTSYLHQDEKRDTPTSDHAAMSYETDATFDAVVGHYESVLHKVASDGITFTEGGNGRGASFEISIPRTDKTCKVQVTRSSANAHVDVECSRTHRAEMAAATIRPSQRAQRSNEPAASSSNRDWAVVSVDSRITESNSVWSRFAWKLALRNDAAEPHVFQGTIEFQDRDGFIVDTSNAYNLLVQGGSEQTFTGFALINAEVVFKVSRTVAKVRRVR